MAEAGDILNQDQFSCPICLDLLKDPVTIPCGHSYCMGCIKGYWNQNDHTGVYSCPQCRYTFTPRPVLKKNTLIAEVVEKLKKTGLQAAPPAHCYAGPGDVACDFCTGRKHKAVKSCLVCLASYCETHLQPHYESPAFKKHNLTPATGHLQEKICSLHHKPLEVYCRSDQQCICVLCAMDEHKGHDTVSAAAERTEKQKQLGSTQRKSQQRIQEREKKILDLRQAKDSLTHSAQAAVEDSESILTELIHSFEIRRSEVTEQIRDQEKTEVSRVERLLEWLEQEIAELKGRDAEMEQLSHTEDHIHFLQSYQSVCAAPGPGDLPSITANPLGSFEAVRKHVSELKERLEDVCKWELLKISQTASNGFRPKLPATVRGQKSVEDEDMNEEEAMFQFIPVEKGDETKFLPWTSMDIVGLRWRLPDLTEGAGKWITALEKSTEGVRLALGDIKALLMDVAGNHVTEEVFRAVGLNRVMTGHSLDHKGFDGYRTAVWAELQQLYPNKPDFSMLEGEKLKEGESVEKFLHTFQRSWREETGSPWNANSITQYLFKLMVKKNLPHPVQERLDETVGLMNMEWPLFSEQITHHVEQDRKERKEADEQFKQLTNELIQLQLSSCSDEAKTPAAVVLAEQSTPNSTVVAPPVAGVPQVQRSQIQMPIPDGSTTPTAPVPQILHIYVNQPPKGRGRTKGRGGQRGEAPNQSGGRGLPSSQGQPGAALCWGCHQVGHRRRICPTNPWETPVPPNSWLGPAGNWQS